MSICKICGGEYYKLRLHLRSHQIDPMDYWVHYVSENHQYPKCLYCGEPILHFINDSFDCGPGVYCNKECMDLDLPRVLSERHENGVYEGTSYLINNWNTNIYERLDSLARTARARLLREEDPFVDGYLYIININGDSIKIGATRQDLEYYLNFRYHYFDYEIIRKFKSNLLQVSWIEYYIKTNDRFKKYLQEGYVSNTEEFDPRIQKELLEFVDNCKLIKRI